MHIAVCDDEMLALREIGEKVKRITDEINFNCSSIDEFNDPLKMLNSKIVYDIVFLDIKLQDPEKNGIWTARELKEKNAECIIIFTTNYESYLDDVIGKYAFRYWVKPIDDERLRKSICEISDRMKTIAVDEFETKKRHRIRLKDIVYITTAGKHCKMITTDNEYILMQSLKDLRGKLSTINFCDCHGSYCVNLDYVEKYTKSEVYLRCGTKTYIVHMSRRSYTVFKEKMFILGGEKAW